MMPILVILAACLAVASGQTQIFSTGFNAYRSASLDVSSGAVVIFDGVQTNMHRDDGGVISEPYSASTGYFTCPVNGVYYFHYSVKSDSLSIFAGEIRLIGTDGVSIVSRRAAVRTQQGLDNVSSACIIQCNVGETVRVVATDSGRILEESGKRYSNFGGMLVYGIFS